MYRDKRKGAENRVISVYKRNDDRWCIEYMLKAKRKYEYRSTELAAQKRANTWREKFGEPLKPLPKAPKKTPGGVAKYWENQLRRASEQILMDHSADTLKMAEMMAKLATAAVKTVGHITSVDDDGDDSNDEQGIGQTDDITKMSTEELVEWEKKNGLESGNGPVLHQTNSEDEEGGGGTRGQDEGPTGE